MSDKRVYKGRVLRIDLINVSAFGLREYNVHFKTGVALYQIHQKKEMPFSVNDFIYFSCEKCVGSVGYRYIIMDVYDESELRVYTGRPKEICFVEKRDGIRIYKAIFDGGEIYFDEETMLSAGRYSRFTIKKRNGLMFINQIVEKKVDDGGPKINIKAEFGKAREKLRLEMEAAEEALMYANLQSRDYIIG